ncbi:MAG TPA: hypothetical protein VN695_16395 [Streptosporangiaceae bacterium]|nr:hypothetical protein [Streptosporangiaceae bacterium]
MRPPLPHRQPKASGHQRAANADELITPVRRVSGSAGAELSAVRPTRRNARPVQPRLQAAKQPATPQELPDNVRYLFSPALPQTGLAAEPADSEAETADSERGRPAPSAGNAVAPAADKPRQRPSERKLGATGSHRRDAAAGPATRLRRRLTWIAAVLVVASTAAGTAFALVRHGSTANSAGQANHQGAGDRQPAAGSDGRAHGIGGLPSAGIVRAQAARWVDREISKSAIIACDYAMCNELLNQGMAASNLLVLSPTAPSPLGADIVIGTPALRSQFGRRLVSEYAPTVIASFGIGKARVDVRVVAPDGAAAYELALSRDLAARQRDGGVLLHNGRISVSDPARPDLIAGLVDPRLLIMLPVLASQHPIEILGFYDRAPRSAQGVPLSGAELAGYDAASGLSAGSYLRWLLLFLRGQRAPYWPTSVTTAVVGGHEIVRVRFSRPNPIGLLTGQ